MKTMKELGPVVLAAVAVILCVGASSSAATTLEVKGIAKNESVKFSLSIPSGSSMIFQDTSGFSQNTCTTSQAEGSTTSSFTGPSVTGLLETLTYSNCTRAVTVHKPGTLKFKYIAGTTNATVESENTVLTRGSSVGTLTCTTGAGTHIGTLTGVASGQATLHIATALNCGLIPSAKWAATYVVTTPSGLGVTE